MARWQYAARAARRPGGQSRFPDGQAPAVARMRISRQAPPNITWLESSSTDSAQDLSGDLLPVDEDADFGCCTAPTRQIRQRVFVEVRPRRNDDGKGERGARQTSVQREMDVLEDVADEERHDLHDLQRQQRSIMMGWHRGGHTPAAPKRYVVRLSARRWPSKSWTPCQHRSPCERSGGERTIWPSNVCWTCSSKWSAILVDVDCLDPGNTVASALVRPGAKGGPTC